MDLTLKPEINVSNAQQMTLCGFTFQVPTLTIGQQIEIWPAFTDLLPMFKRRASALAAATTAPAPDLDGAASMTLLAEIAATKTETQDMLTIIHAGVSRAQPNVKLDDLWQLPATVDDLIEAVNVIMSAMPKAKPKVSADG